MHHILLTLLLSLSLIFVGLIPSVAAQPVVQSRAAGIRTERRINETTPITDKATGKSVSYKAYQELMKVDPKAYRLDPIYDEYGKASSYTMRPATTDEQGTNMSYGRDLTKQPKAGQVMPLVIMKGLDGKEYHSDKLKGRVVVMSFWINLQKPFWSPQLPKAFADAIRPYQSETEPVVLGVLQDSQESIERYMATETLPFLPVPDAYGFHGKFQISRIPSFIVIDRAGNVAAFVEGANYPELKKVLERVSR